MAEHAMTAVTNGAATRHAHGDWRDQAACLDHDPEAFYPESTRTAAATTAKRICQRCPVRLDCLTYALDTDQLYGVWGGLTEKERGRIQSLIRRGDVDRAWQIAGELAEPIDPAAAPLTRASDIVARYQAGQSCTALAQEYRVTSATILRWLRDEGVEIRTRLEAQPRRSTCMRGHPLTEDNAYFNGTHADGSQRLSCRRCHMARQRRRCVGCDRYLKRNETAECGPCAQRRRVSR